MNDIRLLSGPLLGSGGRGQIQVQGRSLAVVLILILIWLLAGGAYVAWQFAERRTHAQVPVTATAEHPASPYLQLLVGSLDAAIETSAGVGANLRHAEDQIGRALPVVEQNDLLVERRRLADALVVTERARRSVEELRQHIQSVRDQLNPQLRRISE